MKELIDSLLLSEGYQMNETNGGQLIWRIPGNFRKIVSYPKNGIGNVRIYNENLRFKGNNPSSSTLKEVLINNNII